MGRNGRTISAARTQTEHGEKTGANENYCRAEAETVTNRRSKEKTKKSLSQQESLEHLPSQYCNISRHINRNFTEKRKHLFGIKGKVTLKLFHFINPHFQGLTSIRNGDN
jgi:hypothetical protein